MPEWIEAPNLKASEHFSYREAACRHCGEIISLDVVRETAEWAEKVRAAMGGLPMHVNSWCRCKVHNTNVGGAPDSYHDRASFAPREHSVRGPGHAHYEQALGPRSDIIAGYSRRLAGLLPHLAGSQ